MFCPKCGKINPDDKELCSGCGAELSQGKTEVPKKKKGRVLKTVLALLVLVVVVCIVILLLNGCATGQIPKEKMTF